MSGYKLSTLLCIGLLSWMSVASSKEPLSIDDIEGRYSFTLADNSKETLSIIKLSPTTAYFDLDRARGGIGGIGDLQPDGLLYLEDRPTLGMDIELEDHTVVHLKAREHYWCRFGIHFGKTDITFTDPVDPQDAKEDPKYAGGTCGNMYGGLVGRPFDRSTRRKLTAVEITKLIRSENFYEDMTRREMFLQGRARKPL
jgi:hypothetical protein